MNKDLPIYVDELFMFSTLLLFLIINYDMQLSNIYQSMVYLTIFMYLTPIMFGLFTWIRFSDEKNRLQEIVVGVAAGIAFMWFYKVLGSITPMATVFATTAFGESETLGKLVFGALIPNIETIFFFVIIPTWVLWKIGRTISKEDMFSFDTIVMVILFAVVFVVFHATAKGITNNLDLIATFAFSILSLGLIFYFKTALSAVILHITINGKSVGLFDFITSGALLSNPFVLIGGAGVIIFLLAKRGIIKVPFLA